MSLEGTRAAVTRYIDSAHTDLSMMADDVVFTTMATGEEGHAVLEGDFVGRHIGDFAGVPATNREVRVPLCVVYDLENDRIRRGRVYFEIPAMLKQLGVAG